MDQASLLAHLRALVEREPDWSNYNATSREHQTWLAQAKALTSRHRAHEAFQIEFNLGQLGNHLTHGHAVAQIMQAVQNVIADLELRVPLDAEVVFAPGAVYDFFRRLNEIIQSAETSIFVVDPYLDDTVFDQYLHGRREGVIARLLCGRYAAAVGTATAAYNAQHGDVVNVRQTSEAHDRAVFVDDFACFAIGQSIKDAAKAKPTYIAPIAPDVVPAKLRIYNHLWETAVVIV